METLGKISEIVNAKLLTKSNRKAILLIKLKFLTNKTIKVLFYHPRFYTLVAYRCSNGFNNCEYEEFTDPFDIPYHIMYNGKDFSHNLDFIKSYVKDYPVEIEYEIIEPKKIGSEDGNFYFC